TGLVARLDQHREDIVPAGAAGHAATTDLVEKDGIDVAGGACEPPPRRHAAQLDAEPGQERERVPADGEETRQEVAKVRHAGTVLEAEDGPEDHLERDPLHGWMEREGSLGLPAVDHAVGDLAHRVAVRLHALAVEGRHHETALVHVMRAVEQQERMPADDRLERRVGLAGEEIRLVTGEDLAHRFGVAHEDDRGTVAGASEEREADGEAVAVAASAGLYERDRTPHPVHHLDERRRARAGREVGRHIHASHTWRLIHASRTWRLIHASHTWTVTA